MSSMSSSLSHSSTIFLAIDTTALSFNMCYNNHWCHYLSSPSEKVTLTCKMLLTLITERLFSAAFFSRASSTLKLSASDCLSLIGAFQFLRRRLNNGLHISKYVWRFEIWVSFIIYKFITSFFATSIQARWKGRWLRRVIHIYNNYSIQSVSMSTVTDLPIVIPPETSENKFNSMTDDIFPLDGADLLDTLLYSNECVSCFHNNISCIKLSMDKC